MKNLLLLFCSLLLSGVFGKDEVTSVKEGGSVTLHIEPNDLKKKSSNLVWRFNNIIIANVKDKEVFDTKDKIFSGRLEMNPQTGDLTITHITSQHSGLYHLEIIGSKTSIKNFSVSVIETEVKSVIKGDNITLSPHQKTNDVKWKFNDTDLTDSRFTNCEVNHQTGDLIISNIRRDQTGEYEVRINGTLRRTFRVIVSGEVKSVSVMEGHDVTLHTNVTRIQAEDVIQWFKDSLIAYSNTTTLTTDRFDMNLAGSLIISNIRSKDSGVYDVYITGSRHIHKRFNVTVTESSQRSNGEKTGPGLLVVLILMGIIDHLII